jgi:hypothetical protein
MQWVKLQSQAPHFKLATIASLMEDGLVTKNTKVDCGNGVAVFQKPND